MPVPAKFKELKEKLEKEAERKKEEGNPRELEKYFPKAIAAAATGAANPMVIEIHPARKPIAGW